MANTEAMDFSQQINQIIVNGYLSLNIALGNQLELFDELAKGTKEKGKTSHDIAEALDLKERYVREWLGAVQSLIDASDAEDEYFLAEHKTKSLCRSAGGSPALFNWIFPIVAATYDDICAAFKKDGPAGVPYERYPGFHHWRHEQTSISFPGLIDNHIVSAMPADIKKMEDGCKVCEIGCSEGVLSLLLAERYPASHFTGIDISTTTVERATHASSERGLQNTHFQACDAAALPEEWSDTFDLIVICDVIHDLGRPDLALKEIIRVLKPGCRAMIVDIAMHTPMRENATTPAAPVIYSISLFHCMPTSLSQGADAWGLGAAWGVERAEELFREAGFSSVEQVSPKISDIEVMYVCTK